MMLRFLNGLLAILPQNYFWVKIMVKDRGNRPFPNDITNLFKGLFGRFFHREIFRIFLDSETIWYVIQKVSIYHGKIYRMLLAIITLQG